MARSQEDERVLAVMRGLNATADSIVGWINEIGALRQANAELAGRLLELQTAGARGRVAHAAVTFEDGATQRLGPPADA